MRHRLTYANVMSTAAVFLALGGGAAYAATRITKGDIAAQAVTTPKLDRNAVTPNKVAKQAVRRGKIADDAVSSQQVEPGSITPADLEFPTRVVASPTGGTLPVVSGGPTPYPLSGGTWTQGVGELDVIFGSLFATLAYDGGGAGSCQVNVSIMQSGNQVGGGNLQTSSTTPVAVVGSAGAAPGADPDVPTQQEVTIELFSNGCTPASQMDRTRLRVLGFGG